MITINVTVIDRSDRMPRQFQVAIDPANVNRSVFSDAEYAVRSKYAFWNTERYTAQIQYSDAPMHGDVVEVL